jgi:hypothetical protein
MYKTRKAEKMKKKIHYSNETVIGGKEDEAER